MYNYSSTSTKNDISVIEEINGHKLSEEQESILNSTGSNCIIACAGSGKTDTLTDLVAYKIYSKNIINTKKILITTFSKAGAEEIDKRLKVKARKLGIECNAKVCTLHSIFYEILTTFGLNSRVMSDSEKQQSLVKTLQTKEYTDKFGKKFYTGEEVGKILGIFSYCNNSLKKIDDIVDSYINELELSADELRYLWKKLSNYKNDMKAIDFDDMQAILYNWLVTFKGGNAAQQEHRKKVIAYIKNRFDYFFIDEAQDTSVVQKEILYCMLRDDNDKLDKIVYFVGDDDQTIYTWRGSYTKFILNVVGELGLGYYKLSTSYRCAKNIIDFSSELISRNSMRYKDKVIKAFRDGGEVKKIDNKSIFDASLDIANEILEKNVATGDTSNCAILVRNNYEASVVNALLAIKGIFANTNGRIGLNSSSWYFRIKDIFKCAYSITDIKSAQKFIGYMSNVQVKQLESIMKTEGISFATLLENICKDKYSDIIRSEQRNDFRKLVDIFECEDIKKRFQSLLFMSVYRNKKDDISAMFADFIMYVCDNCKEKAIDVLDRIENMRTNEVSNEKSPYISTVHGVKGLEWENIYILHVDYDNFISRLDKLSKTEDKEAILEYVEEERRIWYVACTRARESLKIFTIRERSYFFKDLYSLA